MALLLHKRKQVGARHQLLAHRQLDGTDPLAVLLHCVGVIAFHAYGPTHDSTILCAIPHAAQQLTAALRNDGVRLVVHVERHTHGIVCAGLDVVREGLVIVAEGVSNLSARNLARYVTVGVRVE